jgi:hypothetical protein
MYIGIPVKYRLLLSDCNETRIFSTYFRKILNIKFRENLSRVSLVIPCGQTDGQTDMTKLVVAFLNLENLHKIPRCRRDI